MDVGTIVTELLVTDADIGRNGEINFLGVIGDFTPQFFRVDTLTPQSGRVLTIR